MKINYSKIAYIYIFLILLVSCSSEKTIVNGINEQDANEMIVLLNSKNIEATKIKSAQTGGTGAQKEVLWDIAVPRDKAIEAMNYLDQEGLPRKKRENLLEIFGNSGLVPSENQEKIRYQAGLAQEIANTIKKIDGVLDANVIISFPEEDPFTGKKSAVITASVYVKHNGILDDPNSHLRSKIQRLVSASVTGLNYDNVTVIGDRAQLTENPFEIQSEMPELVKVWSIELTKDSTSRFHVIFFSLLISNIILAFFIIWFLWKLYPLLKQISYHDLLNIKQIHSIEQDQEIKKQDQEIKSEEPKKNDTDET